nr:MAG TPA: hypothetical protein [Caudoviricetes sp.]
MSRPVSNVCQAVSYGKNRCNGRKGCCCGIIRRYKKQSPAFQTGLSGHSMARKV